MQAEIVAVGTELLLGYLVDTNSSWIGDRLARSGIDCLLAVKVGDNPLRIADAVRSSLQRADAVICCGGLGPTHDNVTRAALALVMGVNVARDGDVERRIEALFAARGRAMTDNNRRQADVPAGASVIAQTIGTAPGLLCPIAGGKVVYAVPGVPAEMRDMIDRVVVPDLMARSGAPGVIADRTLRTWGRGESALSAALAARIHALDVAGNPAIAFLASAHEGVKVRLTAKVTAADDASPDNTVTDLAVALLDAEEAEVRGVLGDIVYGVDDQTIESIVAGALLAGGHTLAVAESLTGGGIGARLTDVVGASGWFRGAVVAYTAEVKRDLLGVGAGPVVSASAAEAMAAGAARLLGADVGLAVTGVAGPAPQEDQPVGTVWIGSWLDGVASSEHLVLAGRRGDIRAVTVIAALDHLRRRLLRLPPGP